MRKIICAIMFVVMPTTSACQRYSVKDAAEKDGLYTFVKPEGYDENIGTTSENEEHGTRLASGGITELSMGEKCVYGNYELTVTDAWHSEDNLLILDGIEGDSEFRDFIVTHYNLGGFPTIDEDGSFIKGGSQYIILKLKIKNISTASRMLNISPTLYNKDDDNEYTMIDTGETMAFDKYSHIDQPDKLHKDSFSYEFNQNEEIETVVVMRMSDSLVALRDVYLSSGFINSNNELNSKHVPDNSSMIKLNIGRYIQ